jgi:RND family efflux transporter MFP subunit
MLGAAAFALALAACHGAERPSSASAPAAPGERYVVRAQEIADLKPVAAVVTSRNQAQARARIGGVLTALYVKEGDLVRRGQLVARVVDQRLGLESRAYDAQTAAAAAESAKAQADYGRIKDLYDHGVYAKARLDQAEAAAKSAAAGVNAARAQHAASLEAGAQGAVFAPADGRVLHADVPAGSVVTPGQTLAVLTAGPTVLRVQVPDADVHGLAIGQTVGLAMGEAASGQSEARVAQIYPDVNAGDVTVDLATPGLGSELIGRTVQARLQIGRRRAIVIPRRLVVTRYGDDYVRVAGKDGRVSDAPVQTAPGPDAAQVEVLSGLNEGDVLAAPGPAR